MDASTGGLRVLVLGATSAIAAEVACLYATRGAQLHLVGRDANKLEAVAARCTGATVTTHCVDFTAPSAGDEVAAAAYAALDRIDVVLIAHGDLGDQLLAESSFVEAERIIAVNFTSVVGLLVPLANRMEAARSGTIAVLTSVAGDRGRPRNYTYGAAKGALHVYLEGLRSRLYRSGVVVTTLKLGPVDTPMTRDHPKTALFATPRRAAADIVAAIDSHVAEAYVPSFWGLIMPIVRSTPERIFQRLPFLSGR